jgi:hypothetical protein
MQEHYIISGLEKIEIPHSSETLSPVQHQTPAGLKAHVLPPQSASLF